MIKLQAHNEKLSAMLAIYEAKIRVVSHFVFNGRLYCLEFKHEMFNLFFESINGDKIFFNLCEADAYNFLVNGQVFQSLKRK
jgi:hypothetical protein